MCSLVNTSPYLLCAAFVTCLIASSHAQDEPAAKLTAVQEQPRRSRAAARVVEYDDGQYRDGTRRDVPVLVDIYSHPVSHAGGESATRSAMVALKMKPK